MKSIKRRSFLKKAFLSGLITTVGPKFAFADTVDNADHFPDESGLVFVFQGDSITDGNRGRNSDPNHIMGHGYAFAIASRIGADLPEAGFTFYNRGISGNKVPDLQKRWQADTLDLKPDVLSILIGINDAGEVVKQSPNALNVTQFEQGYRDLLQQSRKLNPNIIFVLGVPFVYEVGARKENWELWKNETEVRAKVVRSLAVEFDAILIDHPMAINNAMKKNTPNYWIWDGIHPTIFTHEIMAREWIKQVSKRLKFLKRYK